MYPSIEFDLINIPLVSTNELHMIGGRGYRKYIMNTPTLFDFYWLMEQKLPTLIDSNNSSEFKEVLDSNKQLAIRLTVKVGMPSGSFFKGDSSNYMKALEDSVKRNIGIDDSRNVTVTVSKYISKDNKWNTHVLMEIYELDFEVPNKWAKSVKS